MEELPNTLQIESIDTKENGTGTQPGLEITSRPGWSSYMTISLVDMSDMSVLLVG